MHDFFQVFSVISSTLAGLWAVGRLVAGRIAKDRAALEEQRNRNTQAAIEALSSAMTKMGVEMRAFREDFQHQIKVQQDQIHEVQLEMRDHAHGIERAHEGIERIFQHWAGQIAPVQQSEKVQIGREAVLIRGKKPGEKP